MKLKVGDKIQTYSFLMYWSEEIYTIKKIEKDKVWFRANGRLVFVYKDECRKVKK